MCGLLSCHSASVIRRRRRNQQTEPETVPEISLNDYCCPHELSPVKRSFGRLHNNHHEIATVSDLKML